MNFVGNSEGENLVWTRFNELLPSDFVSFHNYYLGLKQADVILLVPKRGILIIEVKGFYGKNVIDVPDNTIIRLKNQPPQPSPFEQAIKYRNLLLSDFLLPNEIDSVYVACAVCYPYITRDEYKSKGLDKISHKRLTITFEDLDNKQNLLDKIDDIFNLAYESVSVPTLVRYGFDALLLDRVGNIISSNYKNEPYLQSSDEDIIVKPIQKRTIYSRFIYTNGDNFGGNEIESVINEWISGTKMFFYTDNHDLLNYLSDRMQNTIKQRGLAERESFAVNNCNTFLFSTGIAPSLQHNFEIINGLDFEKFNNEFNVLHNESSFNKDQYAIEHAPLNDIIVKAGAGTGKTFSIVSRINYLIWKNEYEATDLKRAIAMITFTNESADAMKEKLTVNFLNYYLLTKNTLFLELIECIEDMNICTIHSMSRKILKKYASSLGLGKDFNIITGNFKRSQVLHSKLNDFVLNHPDFENKVEVSMFHLGERLISFLEKLDNKNVDIVADKSVLSFGRATNPVFDDLVDVICDTQNEMYHYCQANNSVSLGDLIRKLKLLCKKLIDKKVIFNHKVDYLFVDEFQDTDDVQIELMKSFKKLFGYNFFVVGDIKQCIYRFRGAEVKAFDTLNKGYSVPIQTISLNKNYRTDTNLMNRLNEIFSVWHTKNDIEYIGDDVLKGTKKYCDTAEIYNIVIDSEQMFEKKMIASINRLLPKLSGSKDKIAILVRYNWQIAEIRNICERNKLNIETEIGGELFRIDPTIDLFKLILALKFNLSPKHLYNLYTTSYAADDMAKIDVWEKKEDEKTDFFYSNLPSRLSKWVEYVERLRTEPVLRVIRDIVDDVKPWEIFAKKIGAVDEDIDRSESYYIRNLDQLFEKLILASNTDYLTINKLSDYLEIMILTRREEESRASYDIEKSKAKIICTTVHKSKGLEFDTVVLPYCEFDVSCARTKGDVDLIYSGNEVGYRVVGSNFKVAFENDLYKKFQQDEVIDRKREEARILYVALTRAIKRVVWFSNNIPGTRKHTNCWDNMIKEVTK